MSSGESKIFQHGPSFLKLEDMLQILISLKDMFWDYLPQAVPHIQKDPAALSERRIRGFVQHTKLM